MKEFFECVVFPITAAIMAFAFIFLGVFGVQYAWEKDQCARYGQLTGEATYYSWSTPCYVKHEGRWMTLDALTKNQADVTVRSK